MQSLVLILALATITQTDYNDPSIVVSRPTMTIYVDERVPAEKKFKDDLNVRWTQLLSSNIALSATREQYLEIAQACKKIDDRVQLIHDKFDIKFVDRQHRDFKLMIGRGLEIQIPYHQRMNETLGTIKFMEYVCDTYFQEKIINKWKKEVEAIIYEEGSSLVWDQETLYIYINSYDYNDQGWFHDPNREPSLRARLPEMPRKPVSPVPNFKF